jgi:hypothetical protein
VVVVVVVVAATPNYLRQASQNLGKYSNIGYLYLYLYLYLYVSSKYTRYMYNDDPLRQPGPHTRSYTPKRWQKPHTRTHTLESDKGHTHTLLHSKTGGAGWISLRGWAP